MSTQVNIGVIGLGRIGQIHVTNILQHVQHAKLIIASDVSADARAWAKQAGVPEVSSSADDVINHPEVQAVIVCAPTPQHVPYTVAAANAGKHIFCEKPLDVSIESIAEAEQIVKARNVKCMVGFNRRFDNNFARVGELVKTNAIGEPHLVRITSRDPAPPPIEYVKVSGGLFMDMSIHDFDMARFVTGSEVTEVYVKGDALVNPDIKNYNDVDTAVIVLTFDNGAIGVIDNSRKAVYGYDQRLEVFGSAGMAKAENNNNNNVSLYNQDGAHGALPLYFFLERYQQAFRSGLQAFVNCIINDTPSPVDAHDGLMATAIGLAANKSLAEQRPVKMEEVLVQEKEKLSVLP